MMNRDRNVKKTNVKYVQKYVQKSSFYVQKYVQKTRYRCR